MYYYQLRRRSPRLTIFPYTTLFRSSLTDSMKNTLTSEERQQIFGVKRKTLFEYDKKDICKNKSCRKTAIHNKTRRIPCFMMKIQTLPHPFPVETEHNIYRKHTNRHYTPKLIELYLQNRLIRNYYAFRMNFILL